MLFPHISSHQLLFFPSPGHVATYLPLPVIMPQATSPIRKSGKIIALEDFYARRPFLLHCSSRLHVDGAIVPQLSTSGFRAICKSFSYFFLIVSGELPTSRQTGAESAVHMLICAFRHPKTSSVLTLHDRVHLSTFDFLVLETRQTLSYERQPRFHGYLVFGGQKFSFCQ